MTLSADGPVETFVRTMGWTASIRDSSMRVSEALLNELMELTGRPVRWTSDAVGTIPVEDGEKWLVQFRTFVDEPMIWRMYERLGSVPLAPRFKFVRRNPELSWEHVGYITQWPSQWTLNSGGLMKRLVETVQNSGNKRKKM